MFFNFSLIQITFSVCIKAQLEHTVILHSHDIDEQYCIVEHSVLF